MFKKNWQLALLGFHMLPWICKSFTSTLHQSAVELCQPMTLQSQASPHTGKQLLG